MRTGRATAHWIWVAAIALLANGSTAGCQRAAISATQPAKSETKMNEDMPLYSWVRDKAAVQLARIRSLHVAATNDGRERVEIDLDVTETLFGDSAARHRRAVLERSAGRTAQLKQPDPVWGRVDLREGASVLVVSHTGTDGEETIYADEIKRPDDPTLMSVKRILSAEQDRASPEARATRRLDWLAHGGRVERLFAAEALAESARDLPAEMRDRIVRALSDVFAAERDAYVRISVGTWLWNDAYPGASEAARVAALNATIAACDDLSPDVRRFACERLTALEPSELQRPSVVKNAAAARELEAALTRETDPAAKRRIEASLRALRP